MFLWNKIFTMPFFVLKKLNSSSKAYVHTGVGRNVKGSLVVWPTATRGNIETSIDNPISDNEIFTDIFSDIIVAILLLPQIISTSH